MRAEETRGDPPIRESELAAQPIAVLKKKKKEERERERERRRLSFVDESIMQRAPGQCGTTFFDCTSHNVYSAIPPFPPAFLLP